MLKEVKDLLNENIELLKNEKKRLEEVTALKEDIKGAKAKLVE